MSKARGWPRVGKCPAPGQCKICKCPTPGTDMAGKFPAVARGGEGLGTAGSSVAPSSQGMGYSGFPVTGMFECGQKSTLPPPPKKIHSVSNKTQKIPAQKLPLPPSAKKKTWQERPCTRAPAPYPNSSVGMLEKRVCSH